MTMTDLHTADHAEQLWHDPDAGDATDYVEWYLARENDWIKDQRRALVALQARREVERSASVKPALLRRSDDQLRELFTELKETWRQETQFRSSVHEVAMHPAYQRIIGLGPHALPLIFEDMRHQSGQWFWALNSIVGEDIAAGAETVREATDLWLGWAEREGFI